MAAHRYWRIYWTRAYPSYYSIAELELHATVGGADLSNVPAQASATTQYSSSGNYSAGAACDGIATGEHYWDSSGIGATMPFWFQYDFGAGNAYDVVEIKLTAPYREGTPPQNFVVKWSDDGTTWTVKNICKKGSAWSYNEVHTFAVPDLALATPVSASQWRVLLTGPFSNASATYMNIAEWQLRAAHGGANVIGGGTASASTEASSSYNASKAIDGNLATGWETTTGNADQSWLQYTFASPQPISETVLTAPSAGATGLDVSYMPGVVEVQFYDGATWQTVAIGDHTAALWTASEAMTLSWTAPASRGAPMISVIM